MTQVAGLWQLADELLAVQREQARAQAEKKGMELPDCMLISPA